MVPREHGAWFMLLTPFFAAVVLTRTAEWSLVPAAVAILVVFMLREPLIVLARQRWVWREPRPESTVAWRWLLCELAVLAAAGLALLRLWPWRFVIGFGAAAGLLTVASVWMTVNNRQRSVALQVVSAGGLASSSLAACVAATGGIHQWVLWLWALCTAHAVASILVVHARLETRIALRAQGKEVPSKRPAWIAQGLLLAGAVACVALSRHWLAAALALSAAVHGFDLTRLGDVVPLKIVGLRALGLSILFALIVIVGLWSRR